MEREYPEANQFGDLPVYGFYCRHVEGLVLDGIELGYDEKEGRPALFLEDVSNADLRMVLAEPPAGDQPVARFQNVRDCFVQGSRALAGTKTWGAVAGDQTARLHEAGNDFTQATNPFYVNADVPRGAVTTKSRSIP